MARINEFVHNRVRINSVTTSATWEIRLLDKVATRSRRFPPSFKWDRSCLPFTRNLDLASVDAGISERKEMGGSGVNGIHGTGRAAGAAEGGEGIQQKGERRKKRLEKSSRRIAAAEQSAQVSERASEQE